MQNPKLQRMLGVKRVSRTFTVKLIGVKKNRYYGWICLLIQVLMVQWIALYPEIVERYYSNGLYQRWDTLVRGFSSYFTFSIGDVLYGLFLLVGFGYLLRWKKTTGYEKLEHLGMLLATFYFFFQLSWGLNYYRQSLAEKWHLNPKYSATELGCFTKQLIAKTNALQLQIINNPNRIVSVPYSENELRAQGGLGYANLQHIHPEISYGVCAVKSSLLNTPLSFMGFSGYLNPFTHEAQINTRMPKYAQGNVICHEMAHQTGIASESECNFIGFLAGHHHPNLYFKYSAYTAALRYCMRALEKQNPTLFDELKIKIHPGILANFKESEQFWSHYDTFINKGFHQFYDRFLKINQQKEGMEGYSKYVGLLLSYFQKNKESFY